MVSMCFSLRRSKLDMDTEETSWIMSRGGELPLMRILMQGEYLDMLPGRIDYYPSPKSNFLFYDSFRRPGAIYWLNNKVNPGSIVAWDINYFTFDFNSLDHANVFPKDGGGDGKSDACFIRCVED